MDIEILKTQWKHTKYSKGMATRLNIEHPLEIYIGFDNTMNKCVIIVSNENIHAFSSSRAIKCEKFKRKNSNYAYIMSLLDVKLEDIFLDMCTDIITLSAVCKNPHDAILTLKNRYEEWIEMLAKIHKNILSQEAQQGLIGELLFLKELIENNSQEKLKYINYWKGPLKEHQDFILSDTWAEIKTIKHGASRVKIASIEQLDVATPGELVIYQLEKTPLEDQKAITLNKIVQSIKIILTNDYVAKTQFNIKLLEAGYEEKAEYDTNAYVIRECTHYCVNNTFPALKRSNIPLEILNAEYYINLSLLAPWETANESQ